MSHHFKIKATAENIATTKGYPLQYGNRYSVGNTTAEISSQWIYFTLHGHTATMFESGMIKKRGFLKNFGY